MARHGRHSSHSHSSPAQSGSEVTPSNGVSPSITSNSTNVEQHNPQLNDTRITQNNTSVSQDQSTHIQQNTTSVQQNNTSNVDNSHTINQSQKVDHSDHSIHVDHSTHIDQSSHDHSQHTIDVHNEPHVHLGGDEKKPDDGGAGSDKDEPSKTGDSHDAPLPSSSAPQDSPSPGDSRPGDREPGDHIPGGSGDEPPHTGAHEAEHGHSGGASHDAGDEGEKGESKAGALNDAFQSINSEWVGKAIDQLDKVIEAGQGLIKGAEAVLQDTASCLFPLTLIPGINSAMHKCESAINHFVDSLNQVVSVAEKLKYLTGDPLAIAHAANSWADVSHSSKSLRSQVAGGQLKDPALWSGGAADAYRALLLAQLDEFDLVGRDIAEAVKGQLDTFNGDLVKFWAEVATALIVAAGELLGEEITGDTIIGIPPALIAAAGTLLTLLAALSEAIDKLDESADDRNDKFKEITEAAAKAWPQGPGSGGAVQPTPGTTTQGAPPASGGQGTPHVSGGSGGQGTPDGSGGQGGSGTPGGYGGSGYSPRGSGEPSSPGGGGGGTEGSPDPRGSGSLSPGGGQTSEKPVPSGGAGSPGGSPTPVNPSLPAQQGTPPSGSMTPQADQLPQTGSTTGSPIPGSTGQGATSSPGDAPDPTSATTGTSGDLGSVSLPTGSGGGSGSGSLTGGGGVAGTGASSGAGGSAGDSTSTGTGGGDGSGTTSGTGAETGSGNATGPGSSDGSTPSSDPSTSGTPAQSSGRNGESEITITDVVHNGSVAHVVTVPDATFMMNKDGTPVADPGAMSVMVTDAMTAQGIKPGEPVMLVGLGAGSQTVAALASDPSVTSKFAIHSVLVSAMPSLTHIPSAIDVVDASTALPNAPLTADWPTTASALSEAPLSAAWQHGNAMFMTSNASSVHVSTFDVDATPGGAGREAVIQPSAPVPPSPVVGDPFTRTPEEAKKFASGIRM